MRRATSLFVVVVAIATLVGRAAAAEVSGGNLRTATSMCSVPAGEQAASREHKAHQRHDALIGVDYSAGMDTQGRAVLRLTAARFEFEKSVTASGETSIHIAAGDDRVNLTLAQTFISVGRGKARVEFDPRLATEEDENKVRRLLVGSRAVRAFRTIVAHLESRAPEEDDYFVTATLVDGALVGLLDGDQGVIGRVARRIGSRQRVRLQAVASRGQDRYPDCWGMYENTVQWAWTEYQTCNVEASDDPWIIRSINMNYCTTEWIFRAESAAFQAMSCAAFR